MKGLVEQAEEAGLEVYNPEEMKERVAEKQYASALIHFLDRESQNVKAMTYPITRIELQQMNAAGNGIDVVRVFVVDDKGRWEEAQ